LNAEIANAVGQVSGSGEGGGDRRLGVLGRGRARANARRQLQTSNGTSGGSGRAGADVSGNYLDGTVTAVLSAEGVGEFNQLEFRGALGPSTATFYVYIDPSLGVSAFGTEMEVQEVCSGRSGFDSELQACVDCDGDNAFSTGTECVDCSAGRELQVSAADPRGACRFCSKGQYSNAGESC